MANVAGVPRQQFSDPVGVPMPGARIYSYASGTSTPLPIFTDGGLTTPHPNPAICDSGGFLTYYLDNFAYKIVVANTLDVTQYTVDPVNGSDAQDLTATATITAGEQMGVGKVAYLSSGLGGLIAGRWYLADANDYYASAGAKKIGIMASDVTIGSVGTVVVDGRVTGLTSLSPGVSYYVDVTDGELTTSLLANSRLVGVADSSTSLIMSQRPAVGLGFRRTLPTNGIVPVGNVGAGEDVLFSEDRPAGELDSDAMSYRGQFWGTTVNNANAKTLRARIIEGANNTIITTAVLTINQAGAWVLTFEAKRISSVAVSSGGSVLSGPSGGAGTVNMATVVASATVTWANAVTVQVTGEATTNNDIVLVAGTLSIVP